MREYMNNKFIYEYVVLNIWCVKFSSYTLKQQAGLAEQIILHLDQMQETRQLTDDELSLRRLAKGRILGLAYLRRAKIRQRSRLTTIQVGDANTRLFHLRANGRRRKTHIPALNHLGATITAHDQKAATLLQHYTAQLGTCTPREQILNWDLLDFQRHDLATLDAEISPHEIREAVMKGPSEKAPGPDGYIGVFFKNAWDIIKHDLAAGIQGIFDRRSSCWNLLNSANIALLPKKDGVAQIGDYRPISLMHSIAKILGKILANRLAPFLDQHVSHSQSAFIKCRCIQDNFQLYRGRCNIFTNPKHQCC